MKFSRKSSNAISILYYNSKTSNFDEHQKYIHNKKTKKNINIELKIRDRCVHQTKNIQCTYITIREEKIKNT